MGRTLRNIDQDLCDILDAGSGAVAIERSERLVDELLKVQLENHTRDYDGLELALDLDVKRRLVLCHAFGLIPREHYRSIGMMLTRHAELGPEVWMPLGDWVDLERAPYADRVDRGTKISACCFIVVHALAEHIRSDLTEDVVG